MNKKFKYVLIFCLAFLYNCQDAIDIEQSGRLSANVAFQTIQDLRDGLIGAYTRFDFTQEIALAAEYTDEVAIGISSGGQGLNNGLAFNQNAGTAASLTFWDRGYGELNALNRVLEGAEALRSTIASEDLTEFNDIIGQALALRAFSHFRLLTYYSTDYADDNALGVPIQEAVPSIADQPLRNTNAEVYASINRDLDEAENLIIDQSNVGFVSRDFILATRARMEAYRGNYPQAAMYARDLLNRYPLSDRTEYQEMFLDASDGELIFKLERTINDPFDGQGAQGSVAAGGWAGNVFAFVNATAGGGSFYEFSRGLFNLFDPADIRFDVSVAPSSVIAPDPMATTDFRTEDVLIIQKYPGSEGQFLLNDLKVYRSSEMLLILAEAAAAAGNFNGASSSTAAYIKQLRDARFGSDQPLATYTSQADAFAAILNERRVELAFEGHRWKDLKRLGPIANQNAVRFPLDCDFNGACELSSSDFRFTLPLPLVEFNGNPGLREQQNPGYQ